MSKKNPKVQAPLVSSAEKTKCSLLDAGKRLFSLLGFDGTTVKDISETAGVNISLVSYYFQGKEGLYRACIEQYGQSRLDAVERMLKTPESVEEFKIRLSMFVDELFNWMLAEPEINMIIQRECDSGLPIAEDIFKATYLKVFETIHDFIAAGKAKKFTRADIDPLVTTQLFFGSLTSFTRSDKLTKRFHGVSLSDENYRKKVKDQAIALFFDGMIDRKEK